MDFGKTEGRPNVFHSDNERENRMWRRLAKVVLGSKEHLRKFLCTVNHDLYVELQNQAKKELEVYTGKRKRSDKTRLEIPEEQGESQIIMNELNDMIQKIEESEENQDDDLSKNVQLENSEINEQPLLKRFTFVTPMLSHLKNKEVQRKSPKRNTSIRPFDITKIHKMKKMSKVIQLKVPIKLNLKRKATVFDRLIK